MSENCGELKLYFAYVSDSSRGEGRFEREPSSEGSQRAITQAKELIERYLQPGWEWGLHIGWSDSCVASSEQEALSLIAHAEANFKNASGTVVPFDRIHGVTRFHRIIRFGGATRDQSDEIIATMKQSGHLPYAQENLWRECGNNEQEFLRRNDERWKVALKFFNPI